MRLFETRIVQAGQTTRLVGRFQAEGGQPEELYFGVPEPLGGFLDDSADAFLPALLVPCMHAGEDLRIDPPVSPQLLRQVRLVQDILVSWHPGFRRVAVEASPREGRPRARAEGVVALFSGGIDSFYTLLRSVKAPRENDPRATHLLFVKGLEQPHHVLQGVEASIQRVGEVARETGTTLVVATTNLRDRFTVNYERCYCGAAMASTVLALAKGIGTLLFPSGHSYAQLEPLGSHPLLDARWSTELLDVVHHGAEARRVDKTATLVVGWPESLPRLRVCLENSGGDFNCGRCRKCLRTMVALEILGALRRASGFPEKLPPNTFELLSKEDDVWLEELQELGRRIAPGSEVTRLVDAVRARSRRRLGLRLFLENTPGLGSVFAAAERLRKSRRSPTP